MTAQMTRFGAAAVVVVVLAASFAMALWGAARERVETAAAERGSALGAELRAAAATLDAAGREALAVLAEGGDFKAAQRAAGRALPQEAWFGLRGLARLERREDGYRLRDAALMGEDGADAGRAAERAVSFRAAAETMAEDVLPHVAAAFPRAALLPAGDGGRGFWLIWRRDDDRGALAAAVALRPRAAVEAGPELAALSLTVAAEPPAAAAPDGRLQAVAPLGDGAAVLTLEAAPTGIIAADILSAVASSAPILASALLMGLLFLVTMRLAAQRDAEMTARCARVMEGVEEKQKALDESKARFRHLAETANVIPWSADLERQSFTYIGPQIEKLTGYAASDWLAQGFWAQHVHPQDRQRVLVDAVAAASEGGYATVDYRIRAAGGRVLFLRNMLSVTPAEPATADRPATPATAQGFLLDVTEMRRAAQALEEARKRAEEANEIKSEFVANMSHELRTPLNAVIGFSEIMKDELFGPLDPKYREYAESVHASGKHLLELINDVLDLSKIEAGRIELTEGEVDPYDLLTECRRLLKERMAAAGLRGELQASDDLPPIRVDERRVKQVILNLLSNAIKFTPAGGLVTLGAARLEAGGLKIWVRDTGVGMKPEEIPLALSKFVQVDGDLARRHQGTGLGLPIAKSLIEMHGGALEVVSAPGEGTEVTITLPADRICPEDDEDDGGAGALRGDAPPESGGPHLRRAIQKRRQAKQKAVSQARSAAQAWGLARGRDAGPAAPPSDSV